MDKKGELTNQFILVLTIVGILIFIALLGFIFAVTAPLIDKTLGDVTGMIDEGAALSGNNNLISATSQSTSIVKDSLQILPWVSYFFLMVMFMGFLGLCFLVRTYPFLIVIWIVSILVLTGISMFLSNAYNDIANNGDQYTTEAYAKYQENGMIMSFLPYIVLTWGVLGGIILFGISNKSQEAGGIEVL